jgi:hypothetical protein
MMVDSVEQRLAQASGDFLVALRMNDGFQSNLYDALTSVLSECAVQWQSEDCIPRLAVNVMVDLVIATQGAAELYPEPVRQQVYDASFHFNDLIGEAVGIDPVGNEESWLR